MTPDNKVAVLDSTTGTVRRVLAEHRLSVPVPSGYDASAEMVGVSVSPDREWVYYGYDWCGEPGMARIFRSPWRADQRPRRWRPAWSPW